MVLARRLLILLVVLVGITALAAGIAPRAPLSGSNGPTEVAPLPPEQTPKPVDRTLEAQSEGQRVVARVGQPVTITVESEVLDTVSLDDLGTKSVEPDSPAVFELLADTPGRYPIQLLLSGRTIGTLEVRPAAD